VDIYPSGGRGSIALILYEVAHGEVCTCRSMNHGLQCDINRLTLGVVGFGTRMVLGRQREGTRDDTWAGAVGCGCLT
jgi:hypothetical protein